MRANWNLTLTGSSCVLVPYREEHVPNYHAWMLDPYIRSATASELLSEAEEFAMQRDWAEDPKKCTFILLDRAFEDTPGWGDKGLGAMVGDVNLFWNDHDDEVGTAEVEIMVAEPESRRKGIAREALRMMVAYASTDLRTTRFRAKIGYDNHASVALFRSLGFAEVSRSDIFREATLEWNVAGDGDAKDDASRAREAMRETWASVTRGTYD